MLRLVQRLPWLHRVAGRSVVVGDVPWVAQSLEAFVSKCFALSYSVASVAVSSGNPCDHLVHRHTHRVVRGTLLAVGRPDGRLNALASAENTICLAVNQASSIQSLGVTCESLTLGHNPFKLGLTKAALFLPTTRPHFISEVELSKRDEEQSKHAAEAAAALDGQVALGGVDEEAPASLKRGLTGTVADFGFAPPQATPPAKGWGALRTLRADGVLATSARGDAPGSGGGPGSPGAPQPSPGSAIRRASRSASALLGAMADMSKEDSVSRGVAALAAMKAQAAAAAPGAAPPKPSLFSTIEPIDEPFIGAWMHSDPRYVSCSVGQLMMQQGLLQRLYESRYASLQRFVGFAVLFHAMARKVEAFWRFASLGVLAYDMSRSHSIMRIATTASPVSGSEVRDRLVHLAQQRDRLWAVLRTPVEPRSLAPPPSLLTHPNGALAQANLLGSFCRWSYRNRRRNISPGGTSLRSKLADSKKIVRAGSAVALCAKSERTEKSQGSDFLSVVGNARGKKPRKITPQYAYLHALAADVRAGDLNASPSAERAAAALPESPPPAAPSTKSLDAAKRAAAKRAFGVPRRATPDERV